MKKPRAEALCCPPWITQPMHGQTRTSSAPLNRGAHTAGVRTTNVPSHPSDPATNSALTLPDEGLVPKERRVGAVARPDVRTAALLRCSSSPMLSVLCRTSVFRARCAARRARSTDGEVVGDGLRADGKAHRRWVSRKSGVGEESRG